MRKSRKTVILIISALVGIAITIFLASKISFYLYPPLIKKLPISNHKFEEATVKYRKYDRANTDYKGAPHSASESIELVPKYGYSRFDLFQLVVKTALNYGWSSKEGVTTNIRLQNRNNSDHEIDLYISNNEAEIVINGFRDSSLPTEYNYFNEIHLDSAQKIEKKLPSKYTSNYFGITIQKSDVASIQELETEIIEYLNQYNWFVADYEQGFSGSRKFLDTDLIIHINTSSNEGTTPQYHSVRIYIKES